MILEACRTVLTAFSEAILKLMALSSVSLSLCGGGEAESAFWTVKPKQMVLTECVLNFPKLMPVAR